MAKRLKKGETHKINELSGSDTPVLMIGMGWDNWKTTGMFSKLMGKRREADLDLSCIAYDEHGERLDTVWYADLSSKDNAIKHMGDDTVGNDHGDDESIMIDLYKLLPEVKKLFIATSTFSEGKTFSDVKNCFTRLLDARDGREIARFSLQGAREQTIMVMLCLERTLDGWTVKAIGNSGTGTTIQDVYPIIRKDLYT